MSYNPRVAKRKKTADPKYSATERACFHREASENVASILRTTATKAENLIALALAERLQHCSSKENHYIASDMFTSEDGAELSDGYGHLYACSSKLCHSCTAIAAKRNRKTASLAIAETPLAKLEYKDYETGKTKVQQQLLRLVTLTIPPVEATCLDTLRIISDAWERFRKTDFFKNYISGFVRGSEFTTRKDSTYHAHIHLVTASVFIPEILIKKHWTNCVEKAFKKAKLEFRTETASGYCVVNIKLAKSVESVLKEVCKYVTKSDSWSDVPAEHLLEIAAVARWPKMFSLGGTFAATAQRQAAEKEESKLKLTKENITSSISDSTFLETIEREPYDTGYLDTKSVSDGFSEVDSSEITEEDSKHIQKPNWRELVKEIGLARYLIILNKQVSHQQLFRKIQLREKYPETTFRDLKGFEWHAPKYDFVEVWDITLQKLTYWSNQTL